MRARWLPWVVVFVVAAAASWWLGRRDAETPMPDATERVILFGPNLNEAAYVTGHGEQIVGVTDYCVWPPQFLELPRIGGMVDPNLERIAALAPQLLVVQGEARTLRNFAIEQSIRLVEVKMDDELESIFAGIETVDRILGGDGSEGARVVRTIRAELAEIAAEADGHRPRAMLSMGHAPQSLESLSVVGAGTFLGELLEIAGARHLYADSAQSYFYLSLESLIDDAPQLVLELRPGQPADEVELDRLRSLWRATVPDIEVAVIDFDGAMIPGPRLVTTARAFRAAVSGVAP